MHASTTAGTATAGTENDWISINDSLLESTELTFDDVNLDDVLYANNGMVPNEESKKYLKSLWAKERQHRQFIINRQMQQNYELQSKLSALEQQNAKLQHEVNTLTSMHQQKREKNMTHKCGSIVTNLNVNKELNVDIGSKIWSIFKPKNSSSSFVNSNLKQKTQQIQQSLNNVQLMQNVPEQDVDAYKHCMHEFVVNLQVQIDELCQLIGIK
mmetsp:Transcript_9502/g.14555  ORF Transcript_9502/g.14555 Transcript_9502/m.14555 type:complete len:213 (-) Transcript_9502:179-817(-)|eukprot:CAMPEP_0202713526 /NCGR_PEP_ID=MMETSP1385-20130828/55586_1 /ASSEMBLY_ACC=CAM_ASM_000861 /TAXON_ID=933848 /ORGANISM="Elphidium margaritaceum" /LENGTH=212 /DNA_ID=CAMNT_0049373905 /DNA_START=38 /DNA_END=676 /DNA_ORIENTATION=-